MHVEDPASPARAGHAHDRLPRRRARRCPIASAARPRSTSRAAASGCRACIDACPTERSRATRRGPQLDLGKCLFCTDCVEACPEGAIDFSTRLAPGHAHARGPGPARGRRCASPTRSTRSMRRLFGRSLKLRQVCAGGCNACEADVNVLGTVVFDLGRFGIQFVASPRHADGLLITGAVSREHAARAREDLRRGARAQARDRGRRLRDLGRSLRRPSRGAERRRAPSCPSISTSPAVRRTRSRSSTACCGCSAGSRTARARSARGGSRRRGSRGSSPSA